MKPPDSPNISDSSDADLARQLLDYLADDAEATDTLEGIAEWWLLRQRVRVVVRQVERVLRRLTEDGKLEVVGAGPERRYRLRGGAGRAS